MKSWIVCPILVDSHHSIGIYIYMSVMRIPIMRWMSINHVPLYTLFWPMAHMIIQGNELEMIEYVSNKNKIVCIRATINNCNCSNLFVAVYHFATVLGCSNLRTFQYKPRPQCELFDGPWHHRGFLMFSLVSNVLECLVKILNWPEFRGVT
jgi:hypothetical protein